MTFFSKKNVIIVAVVSFLFLVHVANSWEGSGGTQRATKAAVASVLGPGCTDLDGDGYGKGCLHGADCNDSDAERRPGAEEECDFLDNDCDGFVDESCPLPKPDAKRVLYVPAGPFVMGSPDGKGNPDEHPKHIVKLRKFWIDAHEVTTARYDECVKAGACLPPAEKFSALHDSYYGNPDFADYPVIYVDWFQAAAFCKWAGGRLPTEAEWEKAARGPSPDERIYPWGDEKPDCAKANFGGASGGCVGDVDLVGRRGEGKSPFGLLDMAGNVWEWVSDWYDSRYYAGSPAQDPVGPEWGSFKVIRGGCYEEGPQSIRVSCRASSLPTKQAPNIGFRCAYDRAP